MRPRAYLDCSATNPVTPEVLQAMGHRLRDGFGNPASDHPLGRAARAAFDRARARVAAPIVAAPLEILFTASATETNNLALLGASQARLPDTPRLAFPGVVRRERLAEAPEVAASLGSACRAGTTAIGPVPTAMGVESARALGTVRLGPGARTTELEPEIAAAALIAAWRHLATR